MANLHKKYRIQDTDDYRACKLSDAVTLLHLADMSAQPLYCHRGLSAHYKCQQIHEGFWNCIQAILMHIIRESVDSLCRDDADTPMPPYIRKAYNRPNAAFVSLFR